VANTLVCRRWRLIEKGPDIPDPEKMGYGHAAPDQQHGQSLGIAQPSEQKVPGAGQDHEQLNGKPEGKKAGQQQIPFKLRCSLREIRSVVGAHGESSDGVERITAGFELSIRN